MIGSREPHTMRRGTSQPLTLLDCEIGSHTGHFAISRVRIDGRKVWGCDGCIARRQA